VRKLAGSTFAAVLVGHGAPVVGRAATRVGNLAEQL
jgi:hypothetical protein